MNDEKEDKKQKQPVLPLRYISRAVLYFLFFLFCLTDFKSYWVFAVIFLTLILINIYFAVRHKDEKPSPVVRMLLHKKSSKKKQEDNLRQRYHETLDKIEKDFHFDETEYDNYDSERKNGT